MSSINSKSPQSLTISVDATCSVSGLLQGTANPQACYIFAHGAGAGMNHPFIQAVAAGLAERNITTLRFQFPYMEQGARRPDPPALAHDTVRAAVAEAGRKMPNLPLFAGGKSFGGRMTSQAQAESPLPGVRGLVFVGFPLHPAGRPSIERAKHLFNVHIPMLFLQGTRDALADVDLLKSVVKELGASATLKLFEAADHSFHVPAKSRRTDEQVQTLLVNTIADWIEVLISK